MTVDIAFSRALLRLKHEEVRALFPGIKVSRAAVLDAGFGQWCFEQIVNGERWAVYVRAENAYEARSEGWNKFIEHCAARLAGLAIELAGSAKP